MKQTITHFRCRAILLFLSLFLGIGQGAASVKIDGIYYELNASENTASVTSGNWYSGSITIPTAVIYNGTQYSVTRIGVKAFYACSKLTSIDMPNTITSIEEEAFSGCENLTSITFPNSVRHIRKQAFSWCSGLTSITLSNTLESIGYESFIGCSSLASIDIPSSVVSMERGAFSDCSGLISITIPNTFTNIGDYVFSNCTSLTSITIPESVTSIGKETFANCTSLVSVTIPNSVTSIGLGAFAGCTSLASITLPESVTSIGDCAFVSCTDLESITIPNSVTSMGERVFEGSTSLRSVSLSASLENIGNYAFRDCTGLISITLPYSIKVVGFGAFCGCSSLESITLPNTLTGIRYAAFWGCSSLASISIPNSVTSIESSAFQECTSLTSIVLPKSLTNIESELFDDCTNLSSITIPSSVTSIGSGAFQNCTSLASITLPTSLTNIDIYAFSGCTGLTSITFPSSLTSIGKRAFEDCTGLTSIFIPKSVTNIEYESFVGCTELSSIVVENGNMVYDSRESCNAIINSETNSLIVGCKNSHIPSSVTSIGTAAFENCTGLMSINIPSSVKNIGMVAFMKCTGLKSINIPNSVESVGAGAFQYCENLESVTFGNSVTNIGMRAFCGCTGLRSIALPNSVTIIDEEAFYYCPNLSFINIPESVKRIGRNAFSSCKELKMIVVKPITPPVMGSYVFLGCSSLAAIYIPTGTMEVYDKDPWNGFNLVEGHPLDAVMTELELLRMKMPAGEADFSNHGVIQSADQLMTNKPSELDIANLVDNDVESYFQSMTDSNNESVENYHYLEVDLGVALQNLWLKHYRRNHTDNAEPKTIRVFAANDQSGDWTEIGVTTLSAGTGTDLIELGAPYRYVRLVVEDTFGGRIVNNNLFFTWSELGIWNATNIPADNVAHYTDQLLADARMDVENGTYNEKAHQSLQLMRDLYAMGHFSRVENMDIDYTREYTHTQWQALYVPFDIPYDEISEDFIVAELNNFHQYDDDNDGTFDRTELEVLHLKSGAIIVHNTPYVIRAKETGVHTISLQEATLFDAQVTTVDCFSLKMRYFFHGTFCGVSGADMFSKQYYAIADGALCQANSSETGLNAFRWYLSIESRGGVSPVPMPARIQIVEKEDNITTDIYETEMESPVKASVYNLGGLCVGRSDQFNSLPKGVYIINGKKFLR